LDLVKKKGTEKKRKTGQETWGTSPEDARRAGMENLECGMHNYNH
jgi:hypothetical protein